MGTAIKEESRSLLLTHDASVWDEVARIFDFLGVSVTYNTSESEALADFYALRSDWGAVGDELRRAMHATRQRSI